MGISIYPTPPLPVPAARNPTVPPVPAPNPMRAAAAGMVPPVPTPNPMRAQMTGPMQFDAAPVKGMPGGGPQTGMGMAPAAAAPQGVESDNPLATMALAFIRARAQQQMMTKEQAAAQAKAEAEAEGRKWDREKWEKEYELDRQSLTIERENLDLNRESAAFDRNIKSRTADREDRESDYRNLKTAAEIRDEAREQGVQPEDIRHIQSQLTIREKNLRENSSGELSEEDIEARLAQEKEQMLEEIRQARGGQPPAAGKPPPSGKGAGKIVGEGTIDKPFVAPESEAEAYEWVKANVPPGGYFVFNGQLMQMNKQ